MEPTRSRARSAEITQTRDAVGHLTQGWRCKKSLYWSLVAPASKPSAMSMTMSIVGIALCGGLGALCAWVLTHALGLTGLSAAIATVVIGMVVAMVLFVAFLALGRAIGFIKTS
jgi:hypothetical protein